MGVIPSGLATHPMPLFVIDRSHGTLNEPEGGQGIDPTAITGLPPLPWRSLKTVWVDGEWRRETRAVSKESRVV